MPVGRASPREQPVNAYLLDSATSTPGSRPSVAVSLSVGVLVI